MFPGVNCLANAAGNNLRSKGLKVSIGLRPSASSVQLAPRNGHQPALTTALTTD